MSCSLNPLKGCYVGHYVGFRACGLEGYIKGTIIGVIKGHTRFLDYRSYNGALFSCQLWEPWLCRHPLLFPSL